MVRLFWWINIESGYIIYVDNFLNYFKPLIRPTPLLPYSPTPLLPYSPTPNYTITIQPDSI
ncbi:MAG: hypothetical protein SWX82_13055 [Cyanobacteriota bacterium]|nr:hypothetical protein [Cyanobacteriota bacterium]